MLPTPRQGYLLVAQAKNPFKEAKIDLSELHGRALCEWHLVLSGETPTAKAGDLVYARKGSADAIIVDDGRVLGLLHEGQISATLPQFSGAQTVENTGADVMANLKKEDAKADLPPIAQPNRKRILMG